MLTKTNKYRIAIFLLGAYFCYSATTVHAQLIDRPDSIQLVKASRKDTIRAVHRLFQARRQGAAANTWIGVALVGSGIALVRAFSALATLPAGGQVDNGNGHLTLATLKISVPGLALISLGLAKGVRFSERKEANLIAAYQQNQSLPASVRRRLRPAYFR